MKRHVTKAVSRPGSIIDRLAVTYDRSPELILIPYYLCIFWVDVFGLRALARNLEQHQLLGWGLTLALLLLALLVGAILVAPAFLGGFRRGGSVTAGLRAFPSFLGTYLVLGCSVWVISHHGLIFYPGLRPRGWSGYLLIPLAGVAGFALAAYAGTVRRRRHDRLAGMRAHRTRAVG